jgi:hypothetical protein
LHAGSSESWSPQQQPRTWHSRAGGGAVHSIKSSREQLRQKMRVARTIERPSRCGCVPNARIHNPVLISTPERMRVVVSFSC